MSSKWSSDFVSPFDATVVRLLRKAGARIVGKTNCDEFGMGLVGSDRLTVHSQLTGLRSFNVHSAHGPVVNPFKSKNPSVTRSKLDCQRSAGGSSGGSAAAVASGLCSV